MSCCFCNSENATIKIENFDGDKFIKTEVCEKCFDNFKYRFNTHCAHCNTYLIGDYCYTVFVDGGSKKHLCEDCKKIYNICEKCGNLFERDTNWCVCYECRFLKYVRDYFYKPEPIFYKMNEDEELYIGVEYEIGGACKENAEKFLKANFKNPHFYSKYDSSIPEYGFEIVSHPATAMAHQSIIPWKTIFSNLEELNIQSTINCGIHFHVNRTFFNEDNIRVADFIVNNFHDLMSVAGGREFNRYCALKTKRLSQWGMSNTSEHHDSLNLCSKNTLEFRFFKSTNNIDDFFRKINFIKHLCYFIKSVKFNDIVEHVSETRKMFIEYMNKNTDYNF